MICLTIFEMGRLTDAIDEITTVLRITQTLDPSSTKATDLIVLANTYLARAFLEQGDLTEASELIDKVVSLECNPVIQRRVTITASDIAYRE